MKFRPTQFGVRGNTASPRQHASRLAVDTDSNAFCIEEEMPDIPRSSPLNNPPTAVFEKPLHAASQRAATGDGERNAGEASAVPTPPTPSPNFNHSFHPLTGT